MAVTSTFTPAALHHDPYPFYKDLRRLAPVHFYEATGEWMVTRWTGCQIMGANPDVFAPSDAFVPMVKTMGIPNVLTLIGEAHRSLRAGIDAPLKAPSVETMIEPLVRPIVRERIAELRGRGEADLTADFFEPVSVRCVADVMGLHDVGDATLARWFHALNAGAQNVGDDAGIWHMLDGVKAEIEAAVGLVYDAAAREPDHSLISHMIHGGLADGERRPLGELLPTLRVIILGGLQEPGHGAANAALGLLADPAQAAAMASDPNGLALKAFDEGLRWIAPIGVVFRRALRAFDIDGVTIPAGAAVAAIVASANRDERRWDDAEVFHLDRRRKPHSAFGYQPHFCSGHALARAIGRVALEECFTHLVGLRLDERKPPVVSGWRFRGAVHLPVRWDA